MNVLQGIPGIAFITAMSFYTEIIDMKRIANEGRLANFVGLVPSTRSSDKNVYSNGISFRHNKFLRGLIIEAAWTDVKEDPVLSLKFKELSKRMKSQDGIIRIAKKLLKRIRHVWLNNEQYAYALVA